MMVSYENVSFRDEQLHCIIISDATYTTRHACSGKRDNSMTAQKIYSLEYVNNPWTKRFLHGRLEQKHVSSPGEIGQ